jgi:hypothetical protein
VCVCVFFFFSNVTFGPTVQGKTPKALPGSLYGSLYPHHFTFSFHFTCSPSSRLTQSRLTQSRLPSLAPFKFHPFSLPPSLLFSLHCLNSSQAQSYSRIASPSDRTYSRVHTHGFTRPSLPGSLLTLTASRRLTQSDVQRISGSNAQCCEHGWSCDLGLENLGSLDLALVGCEHGFSCDLGLETMAGLCCLVTLVLFSCDCSADWDLGTGVVPLWGGHGFVSCNPTHNWVVWVTSFDRLIIGRVHVEPEYVIGSAGSTQTRPAKPNCEL